ncbi:PEP-CTERM sorting domain-containing protein [Singulisphaera sp. Ch08]|uniref:PEP-CTERM sorting domain-containing protein n=1 Tax=Singulisphaera sp. Ch08 TaxID=3120278 RepID=A0AAU7CFU7_9BACT
MSVRLAGLTRCGFSAVAAVLLAVSAAVAEPIYTVTDMGVSSDSLLTPGDSAMDVITQRRVTLDPSGKVSIETWERPGDYEGPLPDSLNPGAYGVDAVAADRAGKNAAGWGFDKERAWAGFAEIDGHATATGNLPDRTWSQALGVNEKGQVVGMSGSGSAGSAQAFLYTPEEGIKGLGQAEVGSAAYAINDSGQLVGELAKGSGPVGRAFTSFNNGPLVDLNRLIDPTLGYTMTRATDINALGQIGAFGLDSLDVMHAFLLTPTISVDADSLAAAAVGTNDTSTPPPFNIVLDTPQTVPEPSVLALFGLVTVGLAARRRIGHRRSF